MWEQYIMDTFALRKGKQPEYILFRSAQLVGTALILVIKADMVKHIRSVESAIKKVSWRSSRVWGLAVLDVSIPALRDF
jgi:hypothetical protein